MSNLIRRLRKHYARHDMISDMFLSTAAAMIVTQLVGVIAGMIDGIITSRFYGAQAYSAVSLSAPILSTVSLFASFIASGAQLVCSQGLGRGDVKRADIAFTAALISGTVISVFFTVTGFCFPDFLASICGINAENYPDIYSNMQEYLRGYLPGIIPLVFVQILGPLAVLANGKKTVTVSAIALCLGDVTGDLLNVFVFDGHTLGMGLATSAACWIELGILASHFFRGKSCFRPRFVKPDHRIMFAVMKFGSPTFVRKLATILRDLFINRFNLVVALTASAVAARSIQSDLNAFMFTLGPGIGKVLLTMSALYYSAEDRHGLTRLFVYSMKCAAALSLAVGLTVFIFAPQVVRIFTSDPEVTDLAVLSVRCMAAGLVFDTISTALQNYLQGIRNLKMVNFMNFGERFFIPVITAAVLGTLFGSRGVLVSVAAGKLLLALVMLVIVCIRKRGLPRKAEDFMFLSDDFGGAPSDNLYRGLVNREDVDEAGQSVLTFCREHGFDRVKTEHLSMYIREMGGNIIRHGKPRSRRGMSAELRVHITEGKLCLTLRDYCQSFDPVTYWKEHENDTGSEKTGIGLVMKSAAWVSYVNTFNSNNTVILEDDYEKPAFLKKKPGNNGRKPGSE